MKNSTTFALILAAALSGTGALAQAQSAPSGSKVDPASVAGSTGGLENTDSKTNPNSKMARKHQTSKQMGKGSATATADGTLNPAGAAADTAAPDTGSKGSLVTNEEKPAKK